MGKSSINGPFSMAMLNNQRVSIDKDTTMEHLGCCTGGDGPTHRGEQGMKCSEEVPWFIL